MDVLGRIGAKLVFMSESCLPSGSGLPGPGGRALANVFPRFSFSPLPVPVLAPFLQHPFPLRPICLECRLTHIIRSEILCRLLGCSRYVDAVAVSHVCYGDTHPPACRVLPLEDLETCHVLVGVGSPMIDEKTLEQR